MPVRLGLIGAGRWGKVYIRTLLSLPDRCRLTHLCTSKPENAALIPHPVTIVPGWRELIAADCDAVIIATPPQTHAELLEACVKAGKPCVVEKPLCFDVATAERLDRLVQAAGIPVLVDHTHVLTSAYETLKRTVKQAGEPVRMVLSAGMGFGPFRTDVSALWDWAPHDISLCLDLLGAMPQEIEVFGGPANAAGEPEMVSVRLQFPHETCAWIQLGRLSPDKRRSFSVMTDQHVYLLDDLAPEKLVAAAVRYSERYAEGAAGLPELLPLKVSSADVPPMVQVISYFLDGLAGADRSRFGTTLALDVTRVLAECDRLLQHKRSRSHQSVS